MHAPCRSLGMSLVANPPPVKALQTCCSGTLRSLLVYMLQADLFSHLTLLFLKWEVSITKPKDLLGRTGSLGSRASADWGISAKWLNVPVRLASPSNGHTHRWVKQEASLRFNLWIVVYCLEMRESTDSCISIWQPNSCLHEPENWWPGYWLYWCPDTSKDDPASMQKTCM